MKRSLLIVLIFVTPLVSAQQIAVKPVITGLDSITSIVNAGDTRLFITLQRGLVVVWDGTFAATFLDIRTLVSCCGERGLLSVVFHPKWRQNGFFYVNYTDLSGDSNVVRYSISGTDPNRGDPASPRLILKVAQPFANHNGGDLVFGPDGYLYIGFGDGGSQGDPNNRAQNLNDLLGKMLRIDVDGGSPYAIPPSNPFVGRTDARPEVWAYGLRNPWRYSFDRVTGDLWIADVGQNLWEEIDFQPATSIGGENYGWRKMEGTHCYNPPMNCQDATITLPVFEYSHSDGCSVTGGYRYRGSRYPQLNGIYFYGDYCSGIIWGARRNADGTFTTSKLLHSPLAITTFGEDMNGEIYVGHYASNGTVYRLVDATPVPPRKRSVAK